MQFFFRAISYLGHPLFLCLYALLFFLYFNPYLFGYPTMSQAGIIIIYTVALTVVIPLVGILLMKGTGLITSLEMPDSKERIGPFILVMVFYLWYYINCRNNVDIPSIYSTFVLGAVISLVLSFISNVFLKVSIHASGWAAWCVFWLWLFLNNEDLSILDMGLLFNMVGLSILLLGIVASGRLYLQAHQRNEVVTGVVLGILAQILAILFS